MADGVVFKHNKGGYVVARYTSRGATGTGGFIRLNHPTSLNAANGSAAETVNSMNIRSIQWTMSNAAFWTVQRGANTVAYLGEGQHTLDFDDGQVIDGLGGEPQANVVITKTGAGIGTLVIHLHKKSSISGGSQY